MRYLYNQTGRSFIATTGDQLDVQIDKGFGDIDDLEETPVTAAIAQADHPVTVAPPADPVSDDDDVNYEVLVIIKNHVLLSNNLIFSTM